MKKILVTGGAGYIGSHTCIELINAGYEPIIIDNLNNSKAMVVDRIEIRQPLKRFLMSTKSRRLSTLQVTRRSASQTVFPLNTIKTILILPLCFAMFVKREMLKRSFSPPQQRFTAHLMLCHLSKRCQREP